MSAPVVGLATCDLSAHPLGDEDEPYTVAALARLGIRGQPMRWDDPAAGWAAGAAVVVRSTWDYPHRAQEFLAWAQRVATVTTLLNPLDAIRWNHDKRYLHDLSAAGVPTVETRYAADPIALDAALAATDRPQLVVKPTVSAGSDLTGRFEAGDEAAAELGRRILAVGRAVMVQPYLESVTENGELAVLHLGGEYSHAVRKGPLLAPGGGLLGGTYREVITPTEPDDVHLACARQVLAAAGRIVEGIAGSSAEPLYARVDLVEGDDGRPLLLELELIEPSLFFPAVPAAADRFAAAVSARLGHAL